jgi:hypothetical protein
MLAILKAYPVFTDTVLEYYHSMSPGPDGICNQMLSHVPSTGKEFLLSRYNCIWTELLVPAAWREAVVIPVPGRSMETVLHNVMM